jgi:threonine dehydratase
MIGIEQAHEARAALAGKVHLTPLTSSATLSGLAGRPVYLKLENLQKTGSFKPRGALYNMMQLPEEARRKGVITISAGNHAQAVAWAARSFSAPAVVVMVASASRTKIDATRGYGAEVVLEGDIRQALARLETLRQERGLSYVHPFDDDRTIAGQATVGLEILSQLPDPETVVVGVGGGGLISGVALAIKALRPQTRVIGVEPEGAAVMRLSLDQGSPARMDKCNTIADGLAAPFAGERNFEIVRSCVDDLVLVSDAEIRSAMRLLLSRCKLLAEPAGAAATAAVLEGRVQGSGSVVAIVSGGNVSPELLADCLTG